MQKNKKIILIFSILFSFLLFSKNVEARSSGWVQNGQNWNYYDAYGRKVVSRWVWAPQLNANGYKTGSYTWKYFDSAGNSIDQIYSEKGNNWLSKKGPTSLYHRGWWENPLNGYKYFFRTTSGTMVTGRQFIDGGWRFFRNSGTMTTGWQYYNESWRYNDPENNGAETTSSWKWLEKTTNPGEFYYKYFNENGESVDLIYRENKNFYLSQAGPDTEYYKGWWTNPANGYKYFFRTTSGTMVTGRQFIDGDWRFFRNSGTMALGWQYYNGAWHYNDPVNDGIEASSMWKWLEKTTNPGEFHYKYFNENGESAFQIYRESNKFYLVQSGPDTEYYKGWWTDPANGQRYYFRTSSGSMVKGWQYIDGGWKYFRSSGTQATGWQFINYENVYIDPETGNHLTGTQVINGKTYTFGNNSNHFNEFNEVYNAERDVTMKGIDVSEWNIVNDWDAVKNSGVQFVMIRVGYGMGYGRPSRKDPDFEKHYAGAKKAGLKVGAYFYSLATTQEEARKEALDAVEYLKGKTLDLPFAIDVEDRLQYHLTRSEMSSVADGFLSVTQSYGHRPMIYASQSWLEDRFEEKTLYKYPIWMANWNSYHTYKHPFSIWQYSESGTVPGIEGNVDLNNHY